MKKQSLAIAAMALFTAACGSVRIARINADPSRYANRTVSVKGRVTNSVGILGTGGYQLDDGTGKIYVLSRTGVPSRGSEVRVTGRVTPGATVLGQPIGVAIQEQNHSVR
jgi:hypothetical protein